MEDQIYSIYKLTCKINGKCYIGFSKDVQNRFDQHSKAKNNQKISRAIRKYGWENFEAEVLLESKDGKWLLNEMEPYFIKQFDSRMVGYNSTDGGEGVIDLTGEIGKKISQTNMGHVVTEETREKLRQVNLGKKYPKGYYKKRSPEDVERNHQRQLGKHHSLETRMKLSRALLGHKRTVGNQSRANVEFTLKTPNGEIFSFKNMSKFCRENQLNYNRMYALSTGKILEYKGWQYAR